MKRLSCCSGSARESEWVYLMGTSPRWHPRCPGSLPVLPSPLGPICVALRSPGTFSGEIWHVFLAAPLATPRSDLERCSKPPWKTGFLALEKVSGGGRAWLASSRSQTRGPGSQKSLALGSSAPHIHLIRPRIHMGFSPGLLSLE